MTDPGQGYLALVLHGHLPFVRHPDQERFLEENWLFEAVVEAYLPLLDVMERWTRDGMNWRLTMTLSPTLCAMLRDRLLQDRCQAYLEGLIELSEKEVHRTHWEPACHALALMYRDRFRRFHEQYMAHGRDLVQAFARHQDDGHLEIIACAATHALLPLLANHAPSLRAQIHVGCDVYKECFGRDPAGFWLPECAFSTGIDAALQTAGIRWFITETHGLLHAEPRPRYGVFAPVYSPHGVAAFGRDVESARQVWSQESGYPADPRYRDFYRDIGYDLDYDYVGPYLPPGDHRSFTGIKYHAITGNSGGPKTIYDRQAALQAAADHAGHFMEERRRHIGRIAGTMNRPPLVVAPYDAELFGHWWYEGPEFLDYLMRKLVYDQNQVVLVTPREYLVENPSLQVCSPSPSSWGDEGYYKVWLNESNHWIYSHLQVAQERMSQLVQSRPNATGVVRRALDQAARELLLAQSSDWPFIMRTGTHPDYARKRVTDHLTRFIALYEQLTANRVDEQWLQKVEAVDNLFPNLNPYYWKD